MESCREEETRRDADEGLESASPSPADRPGQNGHTKEDREDRGKREDKADVADLSSINTIMSTVMSAAHLDRAAPSTPDTDAKAQARAAARSATGKRTQVPNQLETKEDPSAFTCPLCEKNCLTQHQLTMHIRQHNLDNGATDHSCSICGKSLSSASSLDRHMLVHSGERPYRCSVCSQTFTTNGNMHRHMKIHDKDPSVTSFSPPSPAKRRRTSNKRKFSSETDGERREEPYSKKLSEEASVDQQESARGQQAQLPCPICFRTFACKYSLETHMETHPDASFRCDLCRITFRTHRSLLRHNASVHKVLPTDHTGLPFIQNNPSIPLGFNDLAFVDFSCRKFPHIAQVWCETNLRRCSSKFHRFICEICNKAFPLQSALDLHTAAHCEPKEPDPEDSANQLNQDTNGDPAKLGFMASLNLQPVSQTKPVPSEDEVWRAELDSIRVIRVQPTKPDLPQEASLPLLDPASLYNLSRSSLSALSLRPFQKGFVLQPDSGLPVNPACGEGGVELADIQQILKMASNQISLPQFAKGQCNAANSGHKQMPQLKPKPLVAPRSSVAASTPPPLTSAHQALPGSVSPNLPPPPNHLLKGPVESSSTSSSSSSSCMARMQMEADCMGDALTPMDADRIKQEEEEEEEEEGGTAVCSTGAPKVGERKATYPCRFCSQAFAFPGLLQAHMRYHLGMAPYQCNICNYVAPDKATLIRHLRTHSGERPYVCRLCSYPFTVKANCERHLRKKHMKNSRKDIEKNIEYVTSRAGGGAVANPPDTGSSRTASLRRGERSRKSRDSQVHLRGHNGCLRKVFRCCRCETLFVAKSVCVQHLLEKHSEVQEREIEDHISSLLVGAASQPGALPQNGLLPGHCPSLVRAEDRCPPDEPLDFSCKSRGVKSESLGAIPGVKVEGLQYPRLSDDCLFLPIDLSVSKNPEGSLKRTGDTVFPGPAAKEVKKEPASHSNDDLPRTQEVQGKCEAAKPAEENSGCPTPYQLSFAVTSPLNGIPAGTARASKLKPLLPKPTLSSLKELPPLASIAQIISSVSAASDLLKRESASSNLSKTTTSKGFRVDPDQPVTRPAADQPGRETSKEESTTDRSRKRARKKSSRSRERPGSNLSNPGSGIDLESSGEFASVEKMLATTDANKFSPYLSGPMVLEKEEGGQPASGEEEKEGQDGKQQNIQQQQQQQPRVKKNAYSNSVQKMNCPFCPRVFPWASSLQRHMLTHTGQKPYPCPNCDALFSTKSNCERHLLRKHGVANRAMRRNGAVTKAKDVDEESPESAESMSETELTPPGPTDPVSAEPAPELPEPQKPFPGEGGSAEGEQVAPTGETETRGSEEGAEPAEENVTDDDSQSNQSLDLDFATKLIDFRFSESNQQQSPSQGAVDPENPKFSCKSCKKSFRLAATLARHQMAHAHDGRAGEPAGKEDGPPGARHPPEERPQEEGRPEERKTAPGSEGADSGSEEEDREREGKSDEDSGSTEPKSGRGERGQAATAKVEKRKKICGVCSKRFWSLQDLTRHTRSHTGERPYKCQTCERTFTLKHSLVRHQRIHQKPRDSDASGRSGSESESAACGAGPASENESEAPPAPEGPSGSSVEETPGKYAQGLLEVHSKPSMELIPPAGEAPLVGAE